MPQHFTYCNGSTWSTWIVEILPLRSLRALHHIRNAIFFTAEMYQWMIYHRHSLSSRVCLNLSLARVFCVHSITWQNEKRALHAPPWQHQHDKKPVTECDKMWNRYEMKCRSSPPPPTRAFWTTQQRLFRTKDSSSQFVADFHTEQDEEKKQTREREREKVVLAERNEWQSI